MSRNYLTHDYAIRYGTHDEVLFGSTPDPNLDTTSRLMTMTGIDNAQVERVDTATEAVKTVKRLAREGHSIIVRQNGAVLWSNLEERAEWPAPSQLTATLLKKGGD